MMIERIVDAAIKALCPHLSCDPAEAKVIVMQEIGDDAERNIGPVGFTYVTSLIGQQVEVFIGEEEGGWHCTRGLPEERCRHYHADEDMDCGQRAESEGPVRVLVRGRLLTLGDGGDFHIQAEDGFVSYCWPMLGIRKKD